MEEWKKVMDDSGGDDWKQTLVGSMMPDFIMSTKVP